MKRLCSIFAVWAAFGVLFAQDVPFLSQAEHDWLVNEISGDQAYEHIRYLTQFHRPRAGSPGLMEAAEYVRRKAEEYGLERVRLIRQKSETVPWSNRYGELWLTTPELRRLASTVQHPLHLSDNSRTAHLDGVELVSVGMGAAPADYEGKDVAGKVVLAFGPPAKVMREAVWSRKAAGIVTYPDPSAPDYPQNFLNRPDSLRWSSIPVEGENGEAGTFGFRLSARQGVELENLLREGKPVLAKIDIESEIGGEPWQVMVEAFIPGGEISDQDIVLTGHLQEEKFSANDDASGCASTLEIARALGKLIKVGKIHPPRRNIRFWWVTEISSQRQYFADHPEAAASILANLNQDMVGADQSQDILRVQNMTRVPFSRFHFLNDVAERTLEFVREGNRGNLAVLQAGGPSPYPRPIFSRLGSRHRYNAEIIPFHTNSDHMTFLEAPIGVPAITFTNWPDNYIHSSDDDLWNIDRTQLQRNAYAVASIAWTMANAGAADFAAIASEASGRGLARLAEDFRLALGWIARSGDAYFQARHQIDQAEKRELRLLDSLLQIAENDAARDRVAALRRQASEIAADYQDALRENCRLVHGGVPDFETLGEWETKLQALTPRLSAGPKEFLKLRSEIERPEDLHGLMAFETLAFVDGRRSGLEIFRAVAAEALRAGRHYYGEVRAEDVLAYLENCKRAGVVEF